MSEKKHHKQKEEDHQAKGEALDTPESQEQSSAELETLQSRLEEAENKTRELEAKSAENLDGWQRSVAEFQNYKKRIERDRDAEKASMKGDLIKKVLPVLDDLERALQNRPEEDPWVNGIDLIKRKLQAILEGEGIQRIEAEGEDFDPNFHEAISYEPVDGVESGRVIAVVQNGYMLGERVIRPAMVRVAK
jgi:molecular chaperone GrpE